MDSVSSDDPFNTFVVTGPNGSANYIFEVVGGSLPPSVHLVQTAHNAAGVEGQFTQIGLFPVTIRATRADMSNVYCELSYTFRVLGITNNTTLPAADICVDYSLQLTADGGIAPYTFGGSAQVPSWMNISTSGLVTGTPQSTDGPSDHTFNLTVRDSEGAQCSMEFTLHVNACPTITITPAVLPNGVVGQAYSGTMSATGGTAPYTWSWDGATHPTGLVLDANTGAITGTPTTSGIPSFLVNVQDKCGCVGSRVCSMSIGTAGNAPLTTVCPTNALISSTVPQNTYVNVGAYAGWNQSQLDALASSTAVNSISGAGCGLCGLSTVVGSGKLTQSISVTSCTLALKVTGYGVTGGNYSVAVLGSPHLPFNELFPLIGDDPRFTYSFYLAAVPSVLLFQMYFPYP